MSEAGWFADPTGRFAQRWYDGRAWTEGVVGASGAVVTDPMPAAEHRYPPPAAWNRQTPPPPASPAVVAQQNPQWTSTAAAPQGPPAQQPPAPAWVRQQWAEQQWSPQQQPWGGPEGSGPEGSGPGGGGPGGGWQQADGSAMRYRPGLGLVVGLVGLVCVVLSLFVLRWVDVDHGTFLDISKAARKVGSDNYPYGTASYLYAAWAGFVLLAATVPLVLLAGVPLPRSRAGNTYARVIGAVVAGGAAVLQTVTIVDVFKGPASPEAGAWLGVAGYLLAIVGLVLGARRVRLAPETGWSPGPAI